MMKHKLLILAVSIVFIAGLVAYLAIANPFGFGVEKGTAEGTTITSLHLESFPAGAQLGPGMTGTETTSFRIGEIAALSAEVTTDGQVGSSIKIYQNGTLMLEQDCVEIEGTGGFGCGFDYPQTSGTYTLKVYIEDTEEMSLDFEVIE